MFQTTEVARFHLTIYLTVLTQTYFNSATIHLIHHYNPIIMGLVYLLRLKKTKPLVPYSYCLEMVIILWCTFLFHHQVAV